MGIGYAIGNVVLAARSYENWAEVIATTAKRREPARVILKNGLVIEAEIGLRFLVREIFFKRVYNPAYLPIEEQDVVVDIGANDGIFTLFAASITRNAVHAIEPSPHNLAILKSNIAVNELHHVIVHECAISDKRGVAKLIVDPEDGQRNRLSDTANTYIEVPVKTLQDIMDDNHLERIDFLKMDCEGSEGSIMRSISEDCMHRIGKIALEYHDHLSELDHTAIQDRLEKAGFTTRLKRDAKSPLGYIYAWRQNKK